MREETISKLGKGLIENAFRYLNLSLGQLETMPEEAIVSFYSAVEIIFKYRLYCEHWTLMLQCIDGVNYGDLVNGNFRSVGFGKANERLISLCDDGLNKNGKVFTNFKKLEEHRNRIVHFYHDFDKSEPKKREVISELLRSWYHLDQIFSKKWNRFFSEFDSKISEFREKIHNTQGFLKVKFEEVKPHLSKYEIIATCDSCEFESMGIESSNTELKDGKCEVCGYVVEKALIIECVCENTITIAEYEHHKKCFECGVEYSFKDQIEAEGEFVKPGDVDETTANCSECNGYQTVQKISGKNEWICTDCKASFNSSEISQCEHCGDMNAHLPEFSSLHGCHCCDGCCDEYD